MRGTWTASSTASCSIRRAPTSGRSRRGPTSGGRRTRPPCARVAAEQARLLDAAADRVRAGGTLVYSTCTISPDENERQVESFLERRPDFRVDAMPEPVASYVNPADGGLAQVLPHRHGTDGFFIARLTRHN